MKVADFDFALPPELIAQQPPAARGASRLLVLDRATGGTAHRQFADLPEFLTPGDLLVLNNTRVFPARLLGHRVPSGGAVECLLLGPAPESPASGTVPATGAELPAASRQLWWCLVHPGQKLKAGARVSFERDGVRLEGEVLGRHLPDVEDAGSARRVEAHGRRVVRLTAERGTVLDAVERIGHIPLPPYIARPDTPADRERYQTVFARHAGSIAAPTAGLHFTEPLLERLRQLGVERAEITLHVGYGTFKPVRVADVEAHEVDPEWYDVSADTAAALTRARAEHRRIVAVGTTTTRALESLSLEGDHVAAGRGETRTFIYPGHRFRLVDGLITNFHLPRSSLLMLVSAFAGRDHVLAAYREAVARRYRFYSYGDAMLVI